MHLKDRPLKLASKLENTSSFRHLKHTDTLKKTLTRKIELKDYNGLI